MRLLNHSVVGRRSSDWSGLYRPRLHPQPKVDATNSPPSAGSPGQRADVEMIFGCAALNPRCCHAGVTAGSVRIVASPAGLNVASAAVYLLAIVVKFVLVQLLLAPVSQKWPVTILPQGRLGRQSLPPGPLQLSSSEQIRHKMPSGITVA